MPSVGDIRAGTFSNLIDVTIVPCSLLTRREACMRPPLAEGGNGDAGHAILTNLFYLYLRKQQRTAAMPTFDLYRWPICTEWLNAIVPLYAIYCRLYHHHLSSLRRAVPNQMTSLRA